MFLSARNRDGAVGMGIRVLVSCLAVTGVLFPCVYEMRLLVVQLFRPANWLVWFDLLIVHQSDQKDYWRVQKDCNSLGTKFSSLSQLTTLAPAAVS